MNRTLSLMATTFIIALKAYGACDPNAIIYSREINFASENFSFSGANNLNISIPVHYQNQRGCWNQQSEMKFEVKVDQSNSYGEASISLPKSRFEKLKDGRTDTYFFIDETHSEFKDAEFTTVSFTCIGQSVLSVESYAGSFEKLERLQKLRQSDVLKSKTGGSTFFATGQAAENLAPLFERRREQFLGPQRALGYDTKVSEQFSSLVESKMGDGSLREFDDHSLQIPSVYIASTTNYNSSSVSQNFSTVKIGKYGCTDQFRKVMNDYRIDNLTSAGKTVGKAKIKFDSSKNRLDLSWGEKPKKKGLFSFL